MTNPDNAVGTNGAYNGRTSVNAFNDDLAAFTKGILSGWACVPSSGLKVNIGGVAGTRDVAIAEDDNGNKTTINNISGSPIELTIDAAPGANSRIDSIVAYVDNPPEGSNDKVDNYEACGLIVVSGTVAANPSAPDNAAIRSAITADGGAGATAYYVVLANVLMASGTTDITSNLITAGDVTGINLGLGGSGVMRFGTKKIMWGSGTVTSVATNTDKSVVVNFPEAFNSVPSVTATVSGWVALKMCVTNATNTSRTNVVINHTQGSTINVPFNWIAIG